VVELSSYQIESAPQLAPRIGLWTTLTPDHLERHGTLERYRSIKRSLLERSAVRILNADDPDLRSGARQLGPSPLDHRLRSGLCPERWYRAPPLD